MVAPGINAWVSIFFLKDFTAKMCQVHVFYHVGHTRVGYSAFGVDFTCTCERVTIILHVQFECKTI